MRLPSYFFLFFLALGASSPRAALAVPLSDGSFRGWEGDTQTTWRLEDGAFTAGRVEVMQPRNEFLRTVREYGDFELTLKWKLVGTEGFVNGGVQFRTQVIPNDHEVSGYQADLGAGFDGALYDESRRNKMLAQPTPEVLEQARKPLGEWNDYRIRAKGARIQIWLNGVATVDYTEADPAIPRKGIIAVQIHGGAKSQVWYKDLDVEEWEGGEKRAAPTGPVQQRFADAAPELPREAFAGGTFAMRPGEVIAILGGTNLVQEGRTGWLETALAVGAPAGRKPRFRNLAWEGDTVYEQWRDLNFGSWREQLEAMGATCVILGFGQMEAMDASRGPEEFRAAYGKLLAELQAVTPRIALLAPLPLESAAAPAGSAVAAAAARLPQWTAAVRQLAAEQGLPFVDVEAPAMPGGAAWTSNGVHATAAGWAELSGPVAASLLGRPRQAWAGHEATRQAIVRKNRAWFDCWRATNWAFAYSDRTEQPFGKAAGGHPALAQELEQYKPRLRQADEAIAELLARGGVASGESAAARPSPGPGPARPPEEERQSFQVRPGFEVNLFASEADGLVKPLAMRWDERGRLWAACSPSYPQLIPGEPPGDYLLVCEDTNGDGRADRFHKFAENLTMPMGMEFGDGGVYVCESTELAFLMDKDGDGVADERRVILSGFGTGDSHQMINSLRRGPDGCLWFSQGLHIFSRIETPYGLVRFDRAGLWRFDPRSWKLQGFFGNAAAGANCWGVTFDDWGQVFHCAADNTPGFYSTPGLGTWPTPPPYDRIGSLAVSSVKGMCLEYLQGSHLPAELQGALCKPVYFANTLSLYRLVDDGSGFKTEELGPLLTSSNGAFRPLGVQVGPDGALYVCDWYNPVIGHYQASYRDPQRDRVHGRIWRVAAAGRPLAVRPALEQMNPGQLLEQLGSPERWVRDQARRLLESAGAGAGPGEEAVAAEAAPEKLFEWLALQCGQGQISEALLGKCLAHPEARLRAFAVRVWAQHWQDRGPRGVAGEEEARRQLAVAVQDPHPRVRLEAAIAAGYLPGERMVEVACRVLDLPRDRFIDYALANTVKALKGVWRPALEAGRLTFGGQAGHLAFVLQSDGGEGLGPVLRALLGRASLEGEARPALRVLLIRGGSAEDVAAAVAAGPVGPEVVAAVSARAAEVPGLAVPAEWLAAIPAWLDSARASDRAAALQLIRAFKLGAFAEAVRAQVRGGEARAVETLAALEGAAAIPELAELSAGSGSAEFRAAALRALAPLDLARAALLGAGMTAQSPGEALQGIQAIFLERSGGAAAWAAALAEVALPREVASRLLEALAQAGRREPELDGVLRPAAGLGAAQVIPEYSAAYVRELAAQAEAQGDGARGGEVFRQALSACLGCHRVGDEGGVTGPNLTAAGRGMTPELIVESVLWPQRQIKEGYFLSAVTLRDGRILSGYKVSEDEHVLALREPGTEAVQSFRRSEIAERRDSGSLMPEGLTAWMSPGQRLDLLKFLFALGK